MDFDLGLDIDSNRFNLDLVPNLHLYLNLKQLTLTLKLILALSSSLPCILFLNFDYRETLISAWVDLNIYINFTKSDYDYRKWFFV